MKELAQVQQGQGLASEDEWCYPRHRHRHHPLRSLDGLQSLSLDPSSEGSVGLNGAYDVNREVAQENNEGSAHSLGEQGRIGLEVHCSDLIDDLGNRLDVVDPRDPGEVA